LRSDISTGSEINRQETVVLNSLSGSIVFDLKTGKFNFYPKNSTSPQIIHAFSEICLADGKKIRSSDDCQRTYSRENFKDDHGEGERVTIYHKMKREIPNFKIVFITYQHLPPVILQIEVENDTSEAFGIERFVVLSMDEGGMELPHLARWRFFKNGWYSWDQSYSIGFDERDEEPQIAGDFLSKFVESEKPGRFVSAWMGMVVHPQSNAGMLAGFVSMGRQMGTITADAKKTQLKITAESFAENFQVVPNKHLSSEKLMLLPFHNGFEALEQYADFVACNMQARVPKQVPTGWCSWYYFFDKVTEDDILENLQFLAENYHNYPVEYVQLDDGYQTAIGDWLSINEKFPHGIKWLCSQIKQRGLKPGLWLAPFCVGANSQLYHQHPDWVVKNTNGRPIVAFQNWNTQIYGLDCTHPEAQAFLRQLFEIIINEWGVKYVKIDFLFAAALRGQRFRANVTSIEAYRKGLEIIRQTVGDKFILGCGAPLGPAVGLVDGMRISEDVGPVWYGNCSASVAIKATLPRYFLHRRLWNNDPDCLLVRQSNTQLNEEEVRSLTTVLALSGGALFLSDDLPSLSEKRKRLFQIVLPVSSQSAIPVDIFEQRVPQVFASKRGKQLLVGVINWEDKPVDFELSLEKIGLDKRKTFHVFEFWEESYLGCFQESIQLCRIPPHGTKLLSLQPAGNYPVLLLHNFHLRQDGVDFVKYHPKDKKLSFRIRPQKNIQAKIFIYVPDNWRSRQVVCECLVRHYFDPKSCILTLEICGSTECNCEIYF